jgi:ribonucleotide reductase alpha subunit|nr:MAG TPA: ribonucleoside-diphosphate reductase, adenosylcobalamin-dependent [Caudoviricetes sp.]
MELKNWLDTQLGQDIWTRKYQNGDETFDQWLDRVSNGDDAVKDLILSKKFIFGGRILASRGITDRKVTYSNCYVLPPVGDSIEEIYDTNKYLARTFSYGGGCGIDISQLRPKGSPVNNAALTTTGAVSFMETFNNTSQTIGQKGRRGALMISMDVNHAEIEDFINAKTQNKKLEECNISVRTDDLFMTRVIAGDGNANELMYKLAENNWNWGEPGMLFWDNINKETLLSEYIKKGEFEFAGVNPCLVGDTLIQTIEGAKPIKDLVGTQPYVYCMNDEGKLIIKQASKVWKTRENAELVEIDFNRGKLICTPDHKIFTRNRGWVKAVDLQPKDKLNGSEFSKGNEIDEVIKLISKNFIVKSVTKLDYTADVYDMTVEGVHNFIANNIIVHNCAEEPLPAGGSCLLGSLNLAEFVKDPFGKRPAFDIPSFKQAVKVAIRALNQVLDEGLPLHPLQIQRDSVAKWRQIGLGIMGFGDMLIKMRIPYGSDRCSNLIATIGMALCNVGLQESALLAKELGTFEAYNPDYILNSFYLQSKIKEGVIYEETIDLIKAHGLRNSQLFTIAPTGSIGTMFGVSTGVEPIYDVNGFARTTKSLNAEDKVYMEYPNIVQRAIEADDIDMLNNKPAYLIGAKDLDFMSRVKTQADWQVWIDASISSTLNLPKESPVEDVFKAYVAAHELGCKGLTVFRDGCKKEGILKGVAKEEKPEPTQLNAIDTDINHCIAFGSKLQTGCGSLWMTVYFHKKTGQLCHIFLNKGSKGGCNSYMVGLSRLISLAGKKGATVEEIVDQLKSVVACPSFVSRKTTEAGISDGRSCAEAVGRELLKLHDQFKINYLNQPEITQLKIDNEVKIEIAKCPECGAELSHTGGCINCYNCGWTKCD